MKKEQTIVYIEGNVGVGKSTFLSFLQKKMKAQVVYEPNESWQNIDGQNLLEAFFKDQYRWAYSLQSYIAITRMDQLLELTAGNYLIERSIYSGRYCFAEVAHDIGTLNSLEWNLYQDVLNRLVARNNPSLPCGFIYLRASAEACYERIKKRGRKEEAPVTMDYLKKLEKKHEDWLMDKKIADSFLADVPVLVLDFSTDLYEDPEKLERYWDEISNFMALQCKKS